MKETYSVNGTGYNSFLTAIAAARKIGAEVIENATGNSRWQPAKVAKPSKTVHVFNTVSVYRS